ncbi:MAG: hypothetical protein HW404_1546, partial [Anaerolineales bacterium]|nr:hypothetical protein [Anaerolineales bacterium]
MRDRGGEGERLSGGPKLAAVLRPPLVEVGSELVER